MNWEIAVSAVKAVHEQSVGVQLLGDIRWVFDGLPAAANGHPADRISSAALVESLVRIEGRPWAEWKAGKPLSQNSLARLLGRFEILSGTIRLGSGETCKGYYRSAFEDAFSCYLPSETVTPSQPNNHGHCDALQSVTADTSVTLSKPSQPNNHGHCDAVTLLKPHSSRMEAIEL